MPHSFCFMKCEAAPKSVPYFLLGGMSIFKSEAKLPCCSRLMIRKNKLFFNRSILPSLHSTHYFGFMNSFSIKARGDNEERKKEFLKRTKQIGGHC